MLNLFYTIKYDFYHILLYSANDHEFNIITDSYKANFNLLRK